MPGEWIEWSGGERPVDPKQPVNVRLRFEQRDDGIWPLDASKYLAEELIWAHAELPNRFDIMQYRLLEGE